MQGEGWQIANYGFSCEVEMLHDRPKGGRKHFIPMPFSLLLSERSTTVIELGRGQGQRYIHRIRICAELPSASISKMSF